MTSLPVHKLKPYCTLIGEIIPQQMFVEKLAFNLQIPEKQAREFVEGFIFTLRMELEDRREFTLPLRGFGNFMLKKWGKYWRFKFYPAQHIRNRINSKEKTSITLKRLK